MHGLRRVAARSSLTHLSRAKHQQAYKAFSTPPRDHGKINPEELRERVMQSIAQGLSHDISRLVEEDERPVKEFDTAEELDMAPGDIQGFMEVPMEDYKLRRPRVGYTGYDVKDLPLRVTDEWLARDDLTETEFSAALIHGRSVHPPIYHPKTHGVPVASILFRSHHLEFLDMFTHFTVHAAGSLGIPCSKPSPCPVRRRLWTVIKSPFIYKKSQENFERRIHSRMVKAWDAHPEVIDRWIAYLETHMIGGVGMRVTRWEHAPVGAGALRAAYVDQQIQQGLPTNSHLVISAAEASDIHAHRPNSNSGALTEMENDEDYEPEEYGEEELEDLPEEYEQAEHHSDQDVAASPRDSTLPSSSPKSEDAPVTTDSPIEVTLAASPSKLESTAKKDAAATPNGAEASKYAHAEEAVAEQAQNIANSTISADVSADSPAPSKAQQTEISPSQPGLATVEGVPRLDHSAATQTDGSSAEEIPASNATGETMVKDDSTTSKPGKSSS
ncbi:hypothetical protein DL96DRAFT_1675956 [Flagelloscypha sp. PMI_526]|nr:hypothetical protein DL96DRAFT_1675956 [Flagelloscypha sp. PMI_526]